MTTKDAGTLSEIHRAVGRIEGQLGTFVAQMAERDTRDAKLEARVRKVENRQHWYSGVAAAIGLVAGALGMHVKT